MLRYPAAVRNHYLIADIKRPVQIESARIAVTENVEIYPVVSWDVVESKFRQGEGPSLIADAIRYRKSVEIRGNADSERPIIASRLFLQSAREIVAANGESLDSDGFKILFVECELDERPNRLPRDPITVRGVPVNYQDGANFKKLKLTHVLLHDP